MYRKCEAGLHSFLRIENLNFFLNPNNVARPLTDRNAVEGSRTRGVEFPSRTAYA